MGITLSNQSQRNLNSPDTFLIVCLSDQEGQIRISFANAELAVDERRLASLEQSFLAGKRDRRL